MNSNDVLCNKEDNIVIPETAFPVKVTNVKNPYFIRIYKTKNYAKKLHVISTKLLNYMKREKLDFKSSKEPNLGNFVIVQNKVSHDIDLPGWFCRGIIGHFNPMTMRYNVLLVDHGISVALLKDDFVIVSRDAISDKFLTSVIGIYNIIPTIIQKHDFTNKYVQFIIDKWTIKAIEFIKQLIIASSAIYFDCKVCDTSEKYYGELYLDIDDEIICLSKALVQNGYATYLEGDLLKLIEGPNNKFRKEINDNVNMYYVQNLDDHNLHECKKDVAESVNCNTKESNFKHKERFPESENLNVTKKENIIQDVLVYSSTKCTNLNFVADAKFPAKVHKAWDLLVKSNKPKKMQSYIWPAIKDRLDVVAIGTKGSGKTFGYTFAITGLLAAQDSLPTGNKPSALILCPSSSEVLAVHSLCMEFLQSYKINAISAFKGKTYRSLAAEIFNGCQILISTPCFLASFMKMYKDLLNFGNLSYLILDNVDVLLDKYYNSVVELFGKYNIMSNREEQSSESVSLQIILAAKHFTKHVMAFVRKYLDNPYVCIASFLEAAIFRSVRPKMYLVNAKYKNQKVLDLLGIEYKLKTMILCTTIDEAKELYTFLSQYKRTLLIHEKQHLFEIKGAKEVWRTSVCGFYSIIICTDEVLSDLRITDVDWLIHYSISLDKQTRFNFRFSTLVNKLQMETCDCKTTIFVNENDNIQFLSIIKMMQRMGVVLSNDMLLNIERISISLDKSKKEYAICDKVKSFGFCPNKSSCIFRHCILPDIDEPITGIKVGDKVKFMLTYVHDASHFSARIIEYVEADSSEIIVFPKDEYIKITSKIQNFYGNISNRKRAAIIDVGGMYGLEDSIESFKRVQVLQIKHGKRNRLETLKLANVRCIDTGNILNNVEVQKLLWLPEELSKLPIHIVEVFLVGIVPCDDEYEWNDCANETVQNWFVENFNKCSYVIGTVSLHISNTIWTNTLEIGTKLSGQFDVVGCCLKSELINKNHATVNDKQMQNILALHDRSRSIKNDCTND